MLAIYKFEPQFDNPVGFQPWIQGILFILAIYHLFLYIQNRNDLFLYYSAFVSCLFLYFLHFGPKMFFMTSVPERHPSTFYGIQFLAYYFYISYVREVITTQEIVPKWDKFLVAARTLLLYLILLISILDIFLTSRQLFYVILAVFVCLTVFAISNYIVLSKIPENRVRLIIVGSIFYLILADVSLFYTCMYIYPEHRLSYDPVIFMQVGAVVESLLFALVIGCKINETEKAKNEAQVDLLQKTVEAAELKIVALKSQMNPHFIFNALNSINNYIIKNDVENASDYLTKFSKLIRKILKNSSENTIALKDELDTIQNYIELENLRIHQGFIFNLWHDPTLNLADIQVPPLFLQPYVENAIWHGLSPKSGTKILDLNISTYQNQVVFRIKDNGVGRNKSTLQPLPTNRSFGTSITKERIHSLDQNAKVIIDDLMDSERQVSGTEVRIYINQNTLC